MSPSWNRRIAESRKSRSVPAVGRLVTPLSRRPLRYGALQMTRARIGVAVLLTALALANPGCGKPTGQQGTAVTSREDDNTMELAQARNALVQLLQADGIRTKLKQMGMDAWEHMATSLSSEEAVKRLMTAQGEQQEDGEILIEGWWIDTQGRMFRGGRGGRGHVFSIYGHFESVAGRRWIAVVDAVTIADTAPEFSRPP